MFMSRQKTLKLQRLKIVVFVLVLEFVKLVDFAFALLALLITLLALVTAAILVFNGRGFVIDVIANWRGGGRSRRFFSRAGRALVIGVHVFGRTGPFEAEAHAPLFRVDFHDAQRQRFAFVDYFLWMIHALIRQFPDMAQP